MKRILFVAACIAGLTSCVKETTAPEERDNPNWRITKSDATDPSFSASIGGITTGFTCKNVGASADSLTYAEITVVTSGTIALSDIQSITFNSGGNSGGWGNGISDPSTNVFTIPTSVNVLVRPYTQREDGFYIVMKITMKSTSTTTGAVTLGIRMFNPRTNKFTTVKPVWGEPCKIG